MPAAGVAATTYIDAAAAATAAHSCTPAQVVAAPAATFAVIAVLAETS